MLKALLSWWLRQLAGALPARWRDAGDDGAATVVSLGTIAGAPGVAEIALRARRGSTHLCRIVLDDTGVATARAALAGRRRPAPVVLRLPQAALLEREVVLPLAAERDPEAVLGFEMDRLTPFRAADVVWQASGFRRDRARQLLSLRLSLLPRSLFADALPALASLGLVPAAIEVPGPATTGVVGWRRLALGTAPAAVRAERRRLRFAAGLVAVLAVVAAALPFIRQSLAERAVASRIAALTPQVDEATALRRRVGHATGAAGAFGALAAQVGDPLAVLAALTGILPDDTYLESLTLQHRRLAVTGRSARAARLIGLLAANPVIRNPAFAAPVTRAPEGGDEFAIRAEVGP